MQSTMLPGEQKYIPTLNDWPGRDANIRPGVNHTPG
jgi:hypothetical protein